MKLTFRPLPYWEGPETSNRQPGKFTATWTDTMHILDREIDTLVSNNNKHTEVVLQVMAQESQMRKDGGLHAGAKVNHPGVVVSFDGPNGPLRFACDKFSAGKTWEYGSYRSIPAWQQNLRAIALGLEALRKIDRYGIAQSGEQYTGFNALGSGIPMPAPSMSPEVALILVRSIIDDPNLGSFEILQTWPESYKTAARIAHPDTGGSTELFQRLQEAKRVLDARLSVLTARNPLSR